MDSPVKAVVLRVSGCDGVPSVFCGAWLQHFDGLQQWHHFVLWQYMTVYARYSKF